MPKPTALHLRKLIYRAAMLAAACFAVGRPGPWSRPLFLLIWAVYMAEMLRRLFPISAESVGCQKQYAAAFQPVPGADKPRLPHGRALAVALLWAAVNACIGLAYFRGLLGPGALALFSLFFAVCDMICVLLFCPFQKWVMKNRCCVVCRIYDWDYAMMFAPLAFLPGFWTWSLFGMGLLLLLKWELAVFRHPERFSERSNAALSCKNCTEKLCKHKIL